MRTLATAVVGVIAGLLAFISMTLTLAWWTAGSASNLSSTVVSIIESPSGAAALGSAVMDEVLQAAPPGERAVLGKRAPELASVAGEALAKASSAIGDIVATAFTAIVEGVRTVLDLGPVLRGVVDAVHQADPRFPATLDGPTTVDFDGSTLGLVSTAITVLGLWWVVALLAAGLLVATAFTSRHGSWRRWRGAGIALAVTGLLFVLLNLATRSLPIPSDLGDFAGAFIDTALEVVSGRGLLIGAIAILLGGALLGISFIRAGEQSPANGSPQLASAGAAGE